MMVSILTCTIRDHLIEEVFRNFNNQVWRDKELIIILNKGGMKTSKWKEKAEQYPNVNVYQLIEETSLGACINYGIEKSSYPYIAKFDDDDYYSPFYLAEAMKAFHNHNASIVGKTSVFMYFKDKALLTEYMPGKENKYTNNEKGLNSKLVMGGTLVFKKEVFEKVQFPDKNVGEDSYFLLKCIENKFKIYSTSKYNYTSIRYSSEKIHTWQVNNQILLKFCKRIIKTYDYEKYVLKREKNIE